MRAIAWLWSDANSDMSACDWFAEGLAATIEWYRANEGRWPSAKEATGAKYAAQGQ